VTPGLEQVAAAELGLLGIGTVRRERGGIEVTVSPRQLYAANLWLRTANRVLVRRAAVPARSFAQLERRVAELPWDDWLAPGPVGWRVSSSRSALYHTGAVAERLARVTGRQPAAAIRRRFDAKGDLQVEGGSEVEGESGVGGESRVEVDSGDDVASGVDVEPEAGSADPPAQLVVARLLDDRLTISVDSSGEALWRRGWRRAGAKAPLRETLAAAMVLASGWDPAAGEGLADPLCGSATIAVEAALLALDRAPCAGRTFAFQRWPSFEPGTWASVTGEARRRARPPGAAPPIVAADRDAGAVEVARANAEAAGVGDAVEVRRAPLAAFSAPAATGWIVTNPPYGRRISPGSDLRDLHAALGNLLRGGAAGWRAALLVADAALARQLRVGLEERFRTTNGGVPVRLLVSAPPSARPGSRPGARRAAGRGTVVARRPPPTGRTG